MQFSNTLIRSELGMFDPKKRTCSHLKPKEVAIREV